MLSIHRSSTHGLQKQICQPAGWWLLRRIQHSKPYKHNDSAGERENDNVPRLRSQGNQHPRFPFAVGASGNAKLSGTERLLSICVQNPAYRPIKNWWSVKIQRISRKSTDSLEIKNGRFGKSYNVAIKQDCKFYHHVFGCLLDKLRSCS